MSDIFGNDKDPNCGSTSGEAGYDAEKGPLITPTWWRCFKWNWLRNPFHNLTWGLLSWCGGPMLSKDCVGYIGWRPDSCALGAAIGRGYGQDNIKEECGRE